VFGAGGDRDRTKRPLMGMVAARMSDVVVITSDNPRTEDPLRIIEEVKLGAEPEMRQGNAEVVAMPDRRAAILHSIDRASTGDVVLIAGKGHEDYQILGTTKIHFDDREEAAEAAPGAGTNPKNRSAS
jgi:UDP-N-acetylmuramoyl-L-alanyl-D-glutamate--2,6-diaminopimelate ligase